MSASNSDFVFQSQETGFDSADSAIIISEGPGDKCVRPARPVLLQLALAERERLARLQELMNQPPPTGKQ